MLRRRRVTLTAVGGAGAASASSTVRVNGGKLVAVRVEVHTLAGVATADLTISNEGQTLFSRSNNIAAGVFYPRVLTTAPDGTAAAAGDNRLADPAVFGTITVDLAQANGSDSISVTLLVDEAQ